MMHDKARSGSSPGSGLRVLVVDDDPDTVATLLEILRDDGHEAFGRGSAVAALQAIHAFMPDVVISDIAMPSVTGWTLAREVRQVVGKHPTLIAITGRYTKSTDKMLSHLTGFNYHLTKPADPNVLLALVASARPAK